MAEEILSSFSPSQLAVLTTVAILAVLEASLLVMGQLLVSRHYLAALFQLSVAIEMGYIVWALATVNINSRAGIFLLEDVNFGWFVLVTLGLALATLWRCREVRFEILPLFIALCFLSPVFLHSYGKVAAVAVIAICVWLGMLLWRMWREITMDVTRFSLKTALDSFPQGLQFFTRSGATLLTNTTMNDLLRDIGINPLLRRRDIIGALEQLAAAQRHFEADKLLRVQDSRGRMWLFRETELHGTRSDSQLVATDVTTDLQLSRKLDSQIAVLRENQARMLRMTAALDRELGETLKLATRNHIHDVLAQRISYVHRFLEDGVDSPQRLHSLQKILLALRVDIAAGQVTTPETWLGTLVDIAAVVGVNLEVEGRLPPYQAQAELFVRVLRESLTNVLIHTSASEVKVRIWEDEAIYFLSVTNPGEVNRPIVFGTGLTGLKTRLAEVSGTLEVNESGDFTLTASIPV
ncbi:MAG: hypothetical protein SPK50_05510 [Mobiluncus porci]|uniref:Sensory histidine kinase UhpB n=1 Tax=Mobiluncus porci TaxID=2652278 RepID=A0A7K0K0X9_9ACTO|nr:MULTISPECIES: hypothetical protein [Mobiluncus]MCI6584578.1 hypothetical protein [Mobiluncus sp.]MDD7541584.1 hypothetical protein [Mobiluncus porci]MDY5748569.1 hypothetical protein [Mobiluncus porci]MST48675.1 hypothetical protein [Mobiluncus porci]